jgi:hypothetical protein
MAARSLLHKSKLEDFKSWLTHKGREFRDGRGAYQVLQIKHGTGWQVIYERLDMPEHLTVTEPLIPLVLSFIRESRVKAIGETAKQLDTLCEPTHFNETDDRPF